MIQLKETAGESLTGAIDGVNYTYETSFDFNPDTVQVYVNGRLKIRAWDDGFTVVPPRTVRMKEPLLEGDSLEVEYQTNAHTGGGALGGRPEAPLTETLTPGLSAEGVIPEVTAQTLVATTEVSREKPSLLAVSLRPAIIGSKSD